ncbi:MAG TPA: HAMP domain-containing sensor histidine kinase [Egibacteraceae bacterium]|nr:HAMP domain-containing sensor histidine kinase [Egibacteraceae bacterium]
MKVLVGLLAVLLAAGLLITEAAMQPTPRDRMVLYGLFAGMTVATALAGWWLTGLTGRLRSLSSTVLVVSMAAVAVAAGAVAVSAATMFLSAHDLRLVVLALSLGVGLGVTLAVAVAKSLERDLERLATAVRQVAEGDLRVRTGIDRADEVGAVAEAMDGMVRRLASAQEARERDEQSRRDLLAAVGHDLRTPLTALQAAVEALQDGMAPDPDRYLASMANDLKLLRGLVDDVFMLARIEAGDVELSLAATDLVELADEAVEAMTAVAKRRDVRLQLEADTPLRVRADPQALGRVLRNLLDNAIRHAPAGSEVTVSVSEADGDGQVMVADEGPGFAEEFRAHALDSFSRADSARARDGGGAGLGLAIVKGLVDAHGGRVTVEQGPGGRVVFGVPLDPGPAIAAFGERDGPASASDGPGGPPSPGG